MKLSQIFGMPAVSGDNKKRGYVLGVTCADGEIEGFVCCDEREYEYFVASESAKLSGGCLTVCERGRDGAKGYRLGLGRAVYDRRGKFIGNLEEGTIKSGKLSSLKVGKQTFSLSDLVLGDVILLKESAPDACGTCEGCVQLKAKDMMIDALVKQGNAPLGD